MPRRRRLAADWVYRGIAWDISDTGSQEPNLSGTYAVSIGLPIDTLTGQVLYDSDNFAETRVVGPVNAALTTRYAVGAWARPQGADKGALIHGCDIRISMRPSQWSTGNLLHFAWRVVVADQDALNGLAQLDTFYDLWRNVAGDATTEAARYANGRQNCAEGRFSTAFGDGRFQWTVSARPRFKRRLMAQEGLFLLLQSNAQSVQLSQLDMHCRTLVTDGS